MKMILNFLYSNDPSIRVVLRLDFLNAISFWDVQRASITLSRPCFDPDRWTADYMQITGESPVALQATVGADAGSSTETSEGLTTKAVQAWPFAKVRESRNIARPLILLPVDSSIEAARLHFSVWNSIHEPRLLNDILDMVKKTGSLSAPSAVYVACLYWLRRSLFVRKYWAFEDRGPRNDAL